MRRHTTNGQAVGGGRERPTMTAVVISRRGNPTMFDNRWSDELEALQADGRITEIERELDHD